MAGTFDTSFSVEPMSHAPLEMLEVAIPKRHTIYDSLTITLIGNPPIYNSSPHLLDAD